MHHPTDRIIHTTAFVTPVVEHWLEREIAQWVHHEGSIRYVQHLAATRVSQTTAVQDCPLDEHSIWDQSLVSLKVRCRYIRLRINVYI